MPIVEISNKKGLVQKSGSSMGGGAGLSLLAINSAHTELKVIQADVSVGAAATAGTSAGKVVPAGFVALACMATVTSAAANAVVIADIGTDADPDCFVDGAAVTANAAGDKGFISCNGLAAINGDAATTGRALEAAADELEVVLDGVPGGTGCTVRVTLVGLVLNAASA